MIKKLLFVLFGMNRVICLAQTEGPVNRPREGIIDCVYIQKHIPTRRSTPEKYPQLDEYVWNRRIWRSIDADSAKNKLYFHPSFLVDNTVLFYNDTILNFNRFSLWDIISEGVKAGKLQAYFTFNPVADSVRDGDMFKYPIQVRQPEKDLYSDTAFMLEILGYSLLGIEKPFRAQLASLIPPYGDSIIDAGGSLLVVYEPRGINWYSSLQIRQYHLMEDWYFDKERSILDVKILGIAPVIAESFDKKSHIRELFWLYYPECEPVFSCYTYTGKGIYCRQVDDLFRMRFFTGSKYKESFQFEMQDTGYQTYLNTMVTYKNLAEKRTTIEKEIRELQH